MKKTAVELLKDTLVIILGSAVYAVGLCVFAAPYNMLSGGASGVAMVINHFTGFPIGIGVFLVNIPIFIAAIFVCGKRYTARTAWCCLLFSLVIDVVERFVTFSYDGEPVVGAIYGGVFMGAGLYLLMMRAIVTGGSDLLAYIIQRKWPAWSISSIVMVIDGLIVLAGSVAYRSTDSALYSVMLVIILTVTLNTLLRGRSSGSMYIILSQRPDEIMSRIIRELDRGVTGIDVKGGYTGKPQTMIMCAVGKRQAGFLRTLVYETDPDAFVIATNAESVYGNGFLIPGKEDIF